MKKLLTIGLLLSTMCLSLSANTDSLKLNKDPIPDTSQITLTKVYNDVKSGLNGLGEALKVGSEHVYGVLIKQQYVLSITLLLSIFLASICGIISYKWARKLHNKFKEENKDSYYQSWNDNIWCLHYTISIILLVGSLVLTLSTISTIITGFVNPEYSALKDIMNFIK